MSWTPAGFDNVYRSVTAGWFSFFFVLNESFNGIYAVADLPLLIQCISRTTKGISGSCGRECRSPRDPGYSVVFSDWIALGVILLEEGV